MQVQVAVALPHFPCRLAPGKKLRQLSMPLQAPLFDLLDFVPGRLGEEGTLQHSEVLRHGVEDPFGGAEIRFRFR